MIPTSIIMILAGFVLLFFGVNRQEAEANKIQVGEKYTDNDPFVNDRPVTILEVSGDYVKYRRYGDAPGDFRSARCSSFRVWFPNKVFVKPTDKENAP